MRSFLVALLIFAAGLSGWGVAQAQLALPSAGESTPADASIKAPGVKKSHRPSRARPSEVAAPDVGSIVGHPLLQNGSGGQLLFSNTDKTLQIDKFTLPGEVIS